MARSSHTDEVARYQQDIVMLREEVDLTKTDLGDLQSQHSQLRAVLEERNQELESEKRAHEDAVNEVSD